MPSRCLPSLRLAAALLIGSMLGGAPAWAERADRQQPLNFAADRLRYDEARQTNVLTGNVVITKGSLVLRAAQVEVRQTPDGHHLAVALAAAGQRAFFRQKREGVEEYLEGEAQRLEYDGRSDSLRMSGNAVLRRYRGTILADEVEGQTILFDNSTETFSVSGSAASGTASGGDGRVRGVLRPRTEPGAAPRESR